MWWVLGFHIILDRLTRETSKSSQSLSDFADEETVAILEIWSRVKLEAQFTSHSSSVANIAVLERRIISNTEVQFTEI